MTVLPSTPIPAGWYPDPAGSFQQRWWNGSEWTNDFAQYRPTLIHSAPVDETIAARLAMFAASSESAAARAAAQAAAEAHNVGSPGGSTTAQSSGSAATQSSGSTQTMLREVAPPQLAAFSMPADDQAPSTSVGRPNASNATLVALRPASLRLGESVFDLEQSPSPTAAELQLSYLHAPRERYNAPAWLLAVLPLLLVGLAFTIASYLPAVYVTSQAILIAVLIAAGIGLAVGDWVWLSRHGHVHRASPAFAILTPLVYLTVRSIMVTRETGRASFGPLVLLLAVVVAIGAAVLLVSGLGALLLPALA